MAWDTEGTRRRLKEAATAEFAEHGLDGTTMTRIAARAGINKERLYSYYGDKNALWEVVLADELDRLAAAVGVRDDGDIGDFAGATYDYHAAHPELARLLQWEGLTRAPAARAAERTARYRDKVDLVARAQREGRLDPAADPAHLVFALIALAAWWQTVPQLAAMITGADPADPGERARRRAFVVEAARRLAAPR
ncbi:TetR family transcriptional regulator [Actinoplanes sp. NBRC 14428]|uniref:TetR family transcriptional regulator n=1 Tax=Pseudosporangium ferrugineum TaxID=439699 RepID=A0A2T0SF90_9ACTN|nr:TetR family transcriptional regulator [Pseudosporangium ferrugineum]PRY32085.1 TetR family transcriptional regulator [Pseudosporangium ferrugineum]BCJ49676.1 TetR family transcriptional regulator [Actinoplanes sp. NBRC 14428]